LKNNGNLDKFEKEEEDFHRRIRNSYLEIARKNHNRFKVINSNQNINIIEKEIYLILDNLFS
jgi:dTMP kinase